MGQQKQNSQRSKSPAVAKSEPKQIVEQDTPQLAQVPRPTTDDEGAWRAYWKAQNQPWRAEPEISQERQEELRERQTIVPDIEKGIYPFGAMELDRADVEWLLATHDGGPVSWHDEDKKREGLDLRGANLFGEDLSGLPLNRLRGGLTDAEWMNASKEQRSDAAVLLIGANLSKAELSFAILNSVDLQNADLQGADLTKAHLRQANLERADLQKARFAISHLEGASLYQAHLEGASLSGARLQETSLRSAYLEDTELKYATLGNQRRIGPHFADIQWGNTNLAVVDWSQVTMVGDEHEARQKEIQGVKKDKFMRLDGYLSAVRANRQLAVALRNQGMNEQADYFAYRAQICQRKVLWYQGWRSRAKWLGSWFLALLAGYAYRPTQTVFWYLFVICCFAIAYSVIGHLPLLPDSLVFSMMSFHGRGFFPSLSGETSLHNPVVICAAIEAVVGLLIEVSFIATFTQRFFGK